jgi:hypothetical protein
VKRAAKEEEKTQIRDKIKGYKKEARHARHMQRKGEREGRRMQRRGQFEDQKRTELAQRLAEVEVEPTDVNAIDLGIGVPVGRIPESEKTDSSEEQSKKMTKIF